MGIDKTVLDKYGLPTIEEYRNSMVDGESELDFYYQFLLATDHIPHKIIEAQTLGKTPKDYTEILEYREYARSEINRLSNVE